ncbi:MAG: hypothetical protein A2653_02260 [Candidatus Zambryskibacteria bacterium RIFCSPHIGHO2_01_FULL_43_25]|uniref:Phosphoenolpyruvate synthase n=1 Tax=Candidatus Zambryskibacteria bacterium RIFCSPLOWO2_01_FULL_45_21 TaxID=1802761 RepID=A0A1G2U4S8_9BACT|nr:MAG: hypothetical protein A2653_02260 [Candidatus Zambryskibacteria bacterium RIFCSPHIGHO2_01_FULL_43_25]OHB01025.1 MAG: hypothetical protein A3E94_02440 [Candidatus Zambryskibacteria bacterium RIFCSPHIGHO2_12_FULL_44_12b]OHB03930.1 MAG: hypothetical protein A3B14_01190 [Candidatus Zambryskibacteria bacterium RIFCSPLOWO2_01_FULL_45_21]
MKYTSPFSKLTKKDADKAGGKGASLGEMTRVGIPVPNGFVILSATFDHFLHETDLTQEIDAILKTVDHKAIHTVERASEKIRGLIEKQKILSDICNEIKKEFEFLKTEFVAVRSSATAEDGTEHAWAGQLESYLNTTEDDLLDKVKKCWSSLFTPRAIFYRFEKELHGTDISVAVVVQKMVQSEVSGVAFSVHPITEDRNQLIIEAGFGLGEAIVSGAITPDSYVVEKEPRKIIDTTVNTQKRGLYKSRSGENEWKEIYKPQASSQVLKESQILELADLIVKIENHYGFPCDIEWAYENGKFYITQSRPITTLDKLDKVKKPHQQYINHISRDMSLTAIYYPFLVQTGIYKSTFEFKSKGLFYFSEKSFLKGYKSFEDDQRVKDQIIKYVKKGKLVSILKNFKKIIDQRIKLTQSFINTDLDKKSQQWVINQFKKFNKFYLRYWSYHLFVFNLDKAIENTLYRNLLKENEKLLNKVRNHNPFLFFDEEYLPHLFNYLAKTFSVKKRLLYFLTPDEIIKLMGSGGNFDWNEIKKGQNIIFFAQYITGKLFTLTVTH